MFWCMHVQGRRKDSRNQKPTLVAEVLSTQVLVHYSLELADTVRTYTHVQIKSTNYHSQFQRGCLMNSVMSFPRPESV